MNRRGLTWHKCRRCQLPYPVVGASRVAHCPVCLKLRAGEPLNPSDVALREVHAWYRQQGMFGGDAEAGLRGKVAELEAELHRVRRELGTVTADLHVERRRWLTHRPADDALRVELDDTDTDG